MPVSELLLLAALIVVGGIVTGILAGLFGIGGGALIVPVLYEVFRVLGVPDEVRIQLCVGTSLAIIVPTNVRSFLTHRDKGAVLMDVVRAWAIPAVVGVAVGSAIAAFAPAAVLKLAFVLIGSVIAMQAPVRPRQLAARRRSAGPRRHDRLRLLRRACRFADGHQRRLDLQHDPHAARQADPQAVATSAGLGVPITIAGTIGYMLAGLPQQALMPPLSIGFVSLIGFALMAPVSSFTAPYGARLAHALSKRQLEIAFGCFLLRRLRALRREPGRMSASYGYPRITSLSPRTSQLSSRLRKLMPSRFVRNCPGCAISAGTARSMMPPTDDAVERDRRGAGAAVRGVDVDRIGRALRAAGRRPWRPPG